MKQVLTHLIQLIVAVLLLSSAAISGDAKILAMDTHGKVVADAVITLRPLFEGPTGFSSKGKAEMRQQDALFAPFVLAIGAGSTVNFPNFDEFRHHVYSFSEAKRFELRLYGQDESKQIQFDTAGVVALGCNIHDNMLAYIYVSEQPIFAKTDEDGAVVFAGLTNGQYAVQVWHPDIKNVQTKQEAILEIGDVPVALTISTELRAVRRHQQMLNEDSYN